MCKDGEAKTVRAFLRRNAQPRSKDPEGTRSEMLLPPMSVARGHWVTYGRNTRRCFSRAFWKGRGASPQGICMQLFIGSGQGLQATDGVVLEFNSANIGTGTIENRISPQLLILYFKTSFIYCYCRYDACGYGYATAHIL